MRGLRYLLVAFFALSFSVLQAGYDTHFHHKTLRMDFFHHGSSNTEEISLYRFIEEPYWGGSLVNLTDTFSLGQYYVEVRDTVSNRLLYSRGFSTLYAEWQDTPEAQDTTRSFPGSVVLPYPKHGVEISIFRYNKQHIPSRIFSKRFIPGTTKVDSAVMPSYPVIDIVVNGTPSEQLDILILAEGYTQEDREKFLRDCTRLAGYLVGASPFREHSDRISIRAIMSYSEESGVSRPDKGIFVNSSLGVSYNTFGSSRYLMTEDFHRVRDVAALAPYDQIIILVNSDVYGGGGIYNFYATVPSDHSAADFLVLHEFGHSFAGLADEYYTSDVAYQNHYDISVEPREANITTLVAFERKWGDLVLPQTPVPTPASALYSDVVGVFEGAGYAEKGIYRPYLNCTMRSVIYDAFCPVCKRAITAMLMFYTGGF